MKKSNKMRSHRAPFHGTMLTLKTLYTVQAPYKSPIAAHIQTQLRSMFPKKPKISHVVSADLLYYPPLYGPENATALYRRFRVSAMQATFLSQPSKEGFFINLAGCALFDSIRLNPYTMSHHQFSYFYYCRQTTKRIYKKYIYK